MFSSGSPRAKRSRLAATSLQRRSAVASLELELCGVISTLGSPHQRQFVTTRAAQAIPLVLTLVNTWSTPIGRATTRNFLACRLARILGERRIGSADLQDPEPAAPVAHRLGVEIDEGFAFSCPTLGSTRCATGTQVAARSRGLRCSSRQVMRATAIIHHGRVDQGVRLIAKPVTFADLAARIRDALDDA